jgi:hypothetical protein
MTTDSVAQSALEKMLAKRQSKAVVQIADVITWQQQYFNLWLWGAGKVGKTDLALRARTDAMALPGEKDEDNPFAKVEHGEIVIPSKPLSIAFANFDRAATTVYNNLPEDVQVFEEVFYQDEAGEQLVPVGMEDADFDRLILRLDQFLVDARDAGMDLAFIDGGTIIWEYIRRWRLPPPSPQKDGGMGNQPSEYAASNSTMRTVMQRFYAAPFHTIVSMEDREKWSSARAPDKDASGNSVMIPDGWNKTERYMDMAARIALVDRNRTDGPGVEKKRVATVGMSIKAETIGRELIDPSFAGLYHMAYPHPLLKTEDVEEYHKLVEKHGPLTVVNA